MREIEKMPIPNTLDSIRANALRPRARDKHILILLILFLMPVLTIKANSKPQMDFLAASEYEVLYGGAAGGGKTEGIIIDPLRYVLNSDYRAIIFRENFPELQKAVLPEALRIYSASGATWNEGKKRFTWGSGAFIDLGYLETEKDWTSYQGTQYTGQYFDEITNIHWVNYEKLGIWNRATAGGIQPYRRLSSNPGGVSHAQVKAYFVDTCPALQDGPQRYSELANMWWQPMRPGPMFTWTAENGMTLTRKFIPARVFDNEDLLRNNPNYLAQLLKLDPQTRKAYLEGDWDVFEGQFFNFNREVHVVPSMIPQQGWAVMSALDYGQRTVLEIQCRDFEGRVINFGEVYTEHQTPTDRANIIADYLLEKEIHNLDMHYDTNMDLNLKEYTGYDKTQASIFRDVFKQRMGSKAPNMMVVSKHTTDKRGYRAVTNEAFKEFLRFKRDDTGKLVERPKFFITSDCTKLIETLPGLIHNPDSPDGLDFDQKIGIDDPYDAAKMCLMALYQPTMKKADTTPRLTTVEVSGTEEYAEKVLFEKIYKKMRQKDKQLGIKPKETVS